MASITAGASLRGELTATIEAGAAVGGEATLAGSIAATASLQAAIRGRSRTFGYGDLDTTWADIFAEDDELMLLEVL